MNVERGAGRRTICKIHKWSDAKSIAIYVEWNVGQRTISRLENDRRAIGLQWMLKEVQEDA